jgi:hypothetical protein
MELIRFNDKNGMQDDQAKKQRQLICNLPSHKSRQTLGQTENPTKSSPDLVRHSIDVDLWTQIRASRCELIIMRQKRKDKKR